MHNFRPLSAGTPGQHRPQSTKPADFTRAGSILVDGLVLSSLIVCAGLLAYGSGRGIDLTDEIFYLIWARDPHAYALVYQPFGYLLHPLYSLVGGDLQAYRIAGFVIVATAGAWLGHAQRVNAGERATFCVYGALAALTIYFPWIITPSYNSAANVGAMLILAGILLIYQCSGPIRLAATLGTGLGLCVAAFSKPPLFAIAVTGIALAATVNREARLFLLTALMIGAASACIFIAPAEIPSLIGRMSATQHVLSLPNTPLALPAKIVRDWSAVPLPLTASALSTILSFVLARSRSAQWLGYAAVVFSLYYVATLVPDAIDQSIPDFLGLAIMTAVAGYAALIYRQSGTIPLAVMLEFVTPVAVGLGTFNNQWFQLNFSMAFPLLALFGLALGDALLWRKVAALALAIISPAAIILLAAWAPYSLPESIFDQQIAIQPPLASGGLLVDDETATFIGSARGLARGALLVDLSGTGPGVTAVLGGRAPVLPWLNPATPTWPDVVWSRLSPSERDTAWFVLPPWPTFEASQPMRWLAARRSHYCRTALPPITFWGEERRLNVWWPCAIATHQTPKAMPA